MTALEVHTATHEPSSCTISVIGPIIACNIATLREHMHTLFTRTCALNAYLDLRCCTHIDIDGIFFLANIRDELMRGGGTMRLVHPPPLIVRLLRQHNFDDLIETNPHDGIDGETKGSAKARTPLSQETVATHSPDQGPVVS